MEGRRVVMADGTELADAEIGYANGHIWCYLQNITLPMAYDLFSDPQKTGTLVFDYGEMQDVYEGFTQMNTIKITEDGVDVRLDKEAIDANS